MQDPYEALQLALDPGTVHPVDVALVNGEVFANLATAGEASRVPTSHRDQSAGHWTASLAMPSPDNSYQAAPLRGVHALALPGQGQCQGECPSEVFSEGHSPRATFQPAFECMNLPLALLLAPSSWQQCMGHVPLQLSPDRRTHLTAWGGNPWDSSALL